MGGNYVVTIMNSLRFRCYLSCFYCIIICLIVENLKMNGGWGIPPIGNLFSKKDIKDLEPQNAFKTLYITKSASSGFSPP